MRSLYSGTVPYHRELDRAINDTWEVDSINWRTVKYRFAELAAGLSAPNVSYNQYETKEFLLELNRLKKLRDDISVVGEGLTYASAGTTAATMVATGQSLTAATGAGIVITGVSIAGALATRFYINKSIVEIKKFSKTE